MADDLTGDAGRGDSAPPVSRILGPCPFQRDDPRFAQWIEVERFLREMQARNHADLLARFSKDPAPDIPRFWSEALASIST